MKIQMLCRTIPLVLMLTACTTMPLRGPASPPPGAAMTDFLIGPIRETRHDGSDDLLTAGLGLDGLRGAATDFADPANPTAAELRRRAIQTSWKGIADLGPLGGYGSLYGSTASVPGREFNAFARLAKARSPHHVMVQVPDHFDASTRCLVVTASSGSRGIYGPIAVAGATGLPHGCAVAYTDKGTGSGYFDGATMSGVALDGRRAQAGTMALEFEPDAIAVGSDDIAVKHAHSGDHPEADWGDHVQQAAAFGLAMLDRAFPAQAPFTASNTRVIAIGLSNGGGAVLRAAGSDAGSLDAVIAVAPSVRVPGQGRALYDYVTEAAIGLPCALLDPRFDHVPFARVAGAAPPGALLRCQSLQKRGDVGANAAADALAQLHASGWTDAAIATAASTTQFDLWRAVAATYASAYLRRPAVAMPCGFRFDSVDARGAKQRADASVRAAWWSDASGIPPGAGVALVQSITSTDDDANLAGLDCLRDLWRSDSPDAMALKRAVAETEAALPRADLPIIVIHGEQDGLIPMAFSGGAYVSWLRANGRQPTWWPIAHGQHFDAFLAFPGFGDRHVPMLAYAHSAFDRVLAALREGRPVGELPAPRTQARGAGALTGGQLGLR